MSKLLSPGSANFARLSFTCLSVLYTLMPNAAGSLSTTSERSQIAHC